MAILSEPDASAWDRLAGRVAAVTDPRLGPQVLANRVARDGAGWSLAPVGPALRRARAAAARLSRKAPMLLRSDVETFYPSVDPAALFGALHGMGTERGEATAVADMLQGWGSAGYPGLPIGPPGSAPLGNAVLHHVDEVLTDVPFLRWVDDYLIGVPSERAADEIVDRLDEALAGLGHRRSRAKTVLLEGGIAPHWPGRASGCRT